ncbi:MAG TPA: hypothetical protein VFT22_05700, partial [Kofleriaceae bacterium]|nr:hypothetical protein [Kofleriaceae bacterium]
LGELYRRALEQARSTSDKEVLARRARALEQQYLTLALDELEAGRASGEDSELLEALIALYRRDFAAAEQRALAVAAHEPGSAEARTLAADAAHGAALAAFDRGDYEGARPGFERATTLYDAASEIARSDATVYRAAAQTWLQRAELDFRQQQLPRQALVRALELIDDRVLRADPEDASAYVMKSTVLLRWYRMPDSTKEDDQLPLLERSEAAARRAVELDPQDVHTWASLGGVHELRGRHEIAHGRPRDPWWNLALQEYGMAQLIQPDDVQVNNALGAIHRWLGTSRQEAGRDPMPELEAALRSYEQAAALDPRYLLACTNQVDVHVTIAEYLASLGTDPRSAVDAAQRVGQECLKIDGHYHVLLDNLAQAQLVRAQHLAESEQGGDPMPALDSARDYLDRAEKVQLESKVVWYHRLIADNAEAAFLLRRQTDPSSAIQRGREDLRHALRLSPKSAACRIEAARLGLHEATWAIRSSKPARPILAQALADAEQAIALGERSAATELTAAEICLQLASLGPSPEIIDRGLCHVEHALARNPRLRNATRVQGALDKLRPQQLDGRALQAAPRGDAPADGAPPPCSDANPADRPQHGERVRSASQSSEPRTGAPTTGT